MADENTSLTRFPFSRRQVLLGGSTLAAIGVFQPFATTGAFGVTPAAKQVLGSGAPIDSLPIPEIYPPLHGGKFVASSIAASPDPMFTYRWDAVGEAENLQVFALPPTAVIATPPTSFTDSESATTSTCNIEVVETGSLRFDFGVEAPAWLEFDSPDLVGDVRMSISEYNQPARVNPGPPNPVKTLTPERVGNTYRLKLNELYFEGVRFGWIHVETLPSPWHITAVRLVSQVKPANYLGSFVSDDERLDRIWYTGAYGARVGFQKDEAGEQYLGAILMDRGDRHSWAGDVYPHQTASMCVFGNYDLVRSNLARISDNSNGIEAYALYWVLSLLDYFEHTGDEDTFRQHIENAVGKLRHGDSLFDEPTSTFFGWDERLGAGFEAATNAETKNVYRAMLIQGLRRFAVALTHIGETELAAEHTAIAEARTSRLRESGADWYQAWGIHALSEAVLADVVIPSEYDAVFEHEFADRVNRQSFSPFNQYFIIKALRKLGRIDEALETVDDTWGGQLDYGGTTFFETFRPDWNDFLGPNDPVPNGQPGWTSLSHPWSSGVTAWISEDVLGIHPVVPGYVEFDFAPNPGLTMRNIAGEVATPLGAIAAQFDARTGKGGLVVPTGTTGRFIVPVGGRKVSRIRVNRKNDRSQQLAVEPDAQAVEGLAAGTWEIHISYRGKPPTYDPGVRTVPLAALEQDRTTHGDWGGSYGADGFVLFNYDAPGTHRSALPAYVQTVTPFEGPSYADWSVSRNTQWTASTMESRALAGSSTNGYPRVAGVVYSTTPSPSGMSMVLDVNASPAEKRQVALYFVDWDRAGRSVAIEIFDLESRKLIAPETLVTDFSDGVYARYEFDRAIRIRICHVSGDNAVVSGVFFDPLH